MKHHNIYVTALLISGPGCTPESASQVGPTTTRKRAGQRGVIVAEVQTTHFGKFALEDADLVQEEDDQRAKEPQRVGNTLDEDKQSATQFCGTKEAISGSCTM